LARKHAPCVLSCGQPPLQSLYQRKRFGFRRIIFKEKALSGRRGLFAFQKALGGSMTIASVF